MSVLLKAVDGSWTTLGGENARGIVPEGVTLTANEGGPDTCSFTLRREAALQWPDLVAFNQCEVWIGGVPVWGGRIWEAPLSSTGEDVIGVVGRGWQYHLDDDLVQRLYVHTNLTDYRDQRSFSVADLTLNRAAPQVQVGDGVITLIFPKDFIVATNDSVGVTLDLGASLGKRVTVTWTRVGGAHGGIDFYSRGSTSADMVGVGGDDNSVNLAASAGSTFSHTFAALRRYHHMFLFFNTVGGAFGADQGVRITVSTIYADTAYESGGASILKASDVVKDARSGAPLLDTSNEFITATSFSIPDLAPNGYQTPRALMTAANAYENKLLGVGLDRKVYYKTRPTTPLIEVGAWAGSQFQDSSTNSGEALYNRVIVQGSGPDGSPINEVRTSTSSLLTRQGFTRTAVLSVQAPMTTASAQAIGDVWLAEKVKPPLKGTLVVAGQNGARWVTGGGIHASEILLRVGERIRLSHLVDPNDGSWGRDGTIKSVSYSHDTETSTIELDNERGRFEALLERLAVVTTQAVR